MKNTIKSALFHLLTLKKLKIGDDFMSYADMALKYLAKGYQLLPVKEKRPLLSYKNIIVTEEFILSNERLYQQATGLMCLCRGLWCIDIDVREDKSGMDSIDATPFKDEVTANSKKTFFQTTPSGGLHLIFKKHEGIDYSQKINYLEGVDIKAHDNNYFIFKGSCTKKGVYRGNDQEPIYYEGDFEQRIFSKRGNYQQQIEDKYSLKNLLPHYDFSHLDHIYPRGRGGLGKQAYDRIINGWSAERNNDLFLASSYANQCNQPLEPLKCLIGTVNADGDVFTESEWKATVESAINNH